MANVNDLLSSALAAQPLTDQNGLLPGQLPTVGQGNFAGTDFYQIAAGQGNQAGAATMGDVETDLRTLNPVQLYAKYGEQATSLINAAAAGDQAFRNDQSLNTRNLSMVAGDTVSGIGGGFANSIAGLGALGLGLVNDQAGTWAAGKIQEGNEWLQGTQSDTLNARRRTTQAEASLEMRDSNAQYERERQTLGEVPASLKRIGRDALSTITTGASDSVTFGQGTSDAVGSLLAGGPIAKGLKAIGSAVLGTAEAAGVGIQTANRLATAGRSAAMPASIAAMEAGGAYQQTAAEVNGMSFDELQANSQDFRDLIAQGVEPEAARTQLANRAGMTAAAIQAPIAAATGKLVARFEEAPFRVGSIGQALANTAIKEPLEEGIQSGTGGLAQNIAIRQNADNTRSLSEGVGEQVGEGALYGFSAAGAVQAPGTAAQVAIRTGQATMSGLKAAGGSLIERGNKIMAQNEEASPISEQQIVAATDQALQQAPATMDEIRADIDALDTTPAKKEEAQQYVDNLIGQLIVDPAEIEAAPESLRSVVQGSTTRVEMVQKLADAVNQGDVTSDGYMDQVMALYGMTQAINDFRRSEAEAIDQLPGDARSAQELRKFEAIVTDMTQSPKVRRAFGVVEKMIAEANVQRVDESNVALAAAKAETAPQTLDESVINRVLEQNTAGTLNLSNDQLAAFKFAQTVVQDTKRYIAESERLGLKRSQDLVSKQVLTDEGHAGDDKKSMLQHAQGILSAKRAGNNNLARALLQDLGDFAQHMQNKVAALNAHVAAGDPNGAGVTYSALQPNRTWKDSPKGMFVNTRSSKSIELAHQVALEAQTLAHVFNSLSDSFSDLGAGHVEAVSLDSRLDGPIQEVADGFRSGSRSVISEATEAPAKNLADAVDNTSAETEQVVEASTSREESVTAPEADAPSQEVTPSVTEREWMKGAQREIRPNDGRARVVEGATSISYDRIGDNVKVNIITTKKDGRGQGSARKALNTLIEMVDRAGLTMELDVAEQDTATDRARLIGFYQSAGFVQDGDTDRMTRDVAGKVEAPVEVADEAPAPTGIAAVYSLNEFGDNGNRFAQAYRLPTEAKTHIAGEDSPLASVKDALSSSAKMTARTNGAIRHDMTSEITDAYADIMAEADGLVSVARANLDKWLDAPYSKTNTKSRRELIETNAEIKTGSGAVILGSSLASRPQGLALNLTDNSLQYLPQLVESAALATMQWMINADNYGQNLDAADLATVLGVDADTMDPNIIELMNQGMSTEEAKRSLASKINSYWGLEKNRNVSMTFTEGLSEAMAGEMLRALEEQGLMRIEQVKLDETNGLAAPKTFNRIIVESLNEQSPVRKYPSAIEEAVMVVPEDVSYMGDVKPPVARTQMNNPQVENTADQVDALTKEQETPFYINMPMVNMWDSLGVDGLQQLFGRAQREEEVLNKRHEMSVEGKNRSIAAAYQHLTNVIAEAGNLAGAQGIEISDLPIRYGYNMSRVGRMQMLGKYNPQANKMVREAILPTRANLDLSNVEHKNHFLLAVAQHLGVKVHNQSLEKSLADVSDKLDVKLSRFVEMIDSMTSGNFVADSQDLAEMIEAFKAADVDLTPGALHGIAEYARMEKSTGNAFTTSLYLEADGMTNGPINAMGLMSIGRFNETWLKNVRKGGISFGAPQTANDIRQFVDQKDLYQTATDGLSLHMQQLRNELANDQYGSEQIDRLMSLMDLFNKDMSFDAETGSLTFKRGIAKNPLTITIYGSGERGIAGNVTDALATAIYQKMTIAASELAFNKSLTLAQAMFGVDDLNADAKMDIFTSALGELTAIAPYRTPKGLQWGEGKAVKSRNNIDPETFQFTKPELENLTSNIQHLFVAPMRAGIADTVGEPLFKAVEVLRQATQVQSIFTQYEYVRRVNEAVAANENGQFLSRAQLDDVFKSLEGIAPMIDTGAQRFLVAGTQKAEIAGSVFGSALNGQFRTDGLAYSPANAGVAGIPFMTIGMGDGMMMQDLARRGLQGTLKIFDGMNIPIDKIMDYSRQANEAVYNSWKGNPLAEVKKSYDAFAKLMDGLEITEEMVPELARALFKGPEMKSATVEDIRDAMTDLVSKLDYSAKSIDARHAAMDSLALSVDQMAAAGAPYHNGVAVNDSLTTDAQVVEALNDAYAKAMAGVAQEPQAPKVTAEVEAIRKVGRAHSSGARILSQTAIKNLAKTIKMTDAQKVMFGEIMRSQGAKDWTIVYGTPEELSKYQNQVHGGDVAVSEFAQGYTVFNTNTIYLVNPDPETLVHELVHATTMDQVVAAIEGRASKEVTDAVNRIEALMNQFLATEASDQASLNARAAIVAAQADLTQHEIYGRAGALNEFMAWSLTNEDLAKALKQKQQPKIVQIAKDVVKAIKSLIWGRKKAPALADDALSALQFNTGIIIREQASLAQIKRDLTLFQNANYGDKQQLADLGQLFAEKISDFMNTPVKQNTSTNKSIVADAVMNASRLAISAQANGFNMTAQESAVFKDIHVALATLDRLQPSSLARVGEIYNHVIKTLKVEDFMPENPIDPQSARYYASQQFDVIVGNTTTTEDGKGRSSLMPQFLALAMVNDHFRSVLSKMDMPKSQRADGRTVDGVLGNLGNDAMDSLSKLMSGEGQKPKNIRDAMDNLMGALYEHAQDNATFIDQYASKAGGILDRGNDLIVSGIESLSDKAATKLGEISANSKNKYVRAAADWGTAIANFAVESKADVVAQGVMATLNKARFARPLHDFMNDLVGRTENNSEVYDMIKRVRSMVSQDRQQFREHIPGVISSKFKRTVSDTEWSTMHRAMGKTDVAALRGSFKDAEIRGLFEDQAKLDAAIAAHEQDLQAVDAKLFSKYQDKSKQLANFMMTGEVGNNLLRNAYAVANLFGERLQGHSVSQNTINTIDRLVSLYAIDMLSAEAKKVMGDLTKNEAEGIDFAMANLTGRRVDEMAKAKTPRAQANQYKGYIPALQQAGVQLVIADDTEFSKLAERSFTRVGSYKGSSLDRYGSSKGYYFAPVSGRAMFNQGIMQNVRQTSMGVDSVTGFTVGMTGGLITNKQEVTRIANALKREGKTVEPLMPIYDDNGRIVAFERSVNPAEVLRLNNDDHFARMMGVWTGRQVEEVKAQYVNEELVSALKDMYDRDIKADPDNEKQYIAVSLDNDKVLGDAVALFTPETREFIRKTFGDSLMVRRDMLNDALGYRQASVGDVWNGTSRWSPETLENAKKLVIGTFGNQAYRWAVNGEKVIQNFVADARTTIVVRSVIVPVSNMISNVYQLVGRGVPMKNLIKGFGAKTAEIDSYVKSRMRLIDAEAELLAVDGDIVKERKLKTEIQAINDQHRRMSIWPLIEAGEFTAISDLGLNADDVELSSGRLNAYMAKLVDKLPESVRTAGRYAVITKDTALYQGLHKAIQYGDFIAKAVLFDDLTQRKGESVEYALGRVSEEFVNYDRLPGRFRGYVESIGLLWFWNFKIRSTKVALSMLRNNPLHSLLAMAAPAPTMFGNTGIPIEDNIVAKLADGSLDYSMGMGQAFRAPMLNPWVNLVN